MSGSILYIHGFNSAPESKKATQLISVMQRMGLAEQLRVPALHHHPREAMAQLQAAISQLGRPLLVGSSLGGYYATWLAEQHGLKALLVNPAVSPHRMFDGYLGTQTNHYSGQTWDLTHDHVQALRGECPCGRCASRSRTDDDGLCRLACRDHRAPSFVTRKWTWNAMPAPMRVAAKFTPSLSSQGQPRNYVVGVLQR